MDKEINLNEVTVQDDSSVGLSADIQKANHAKKWVKRSAHQDETLHVLLKKRKPIAVNQTHSIHQEAGPRTGKGQDIYVPDAVPEGNFKPITIPTGKPTFITIDLETTGLIQGDLYPHITQIAAIEIESAQSFATYVLPKLPMSPGAQRVTGVEVTDSGIMKVNGQTVDPVSIHTAIQKLCQWLNNFPNVVLVAHNGRMFDFPVLISALDGTDTVEVFLSSVSGVIDSLPIFKRQFPGLRSHSQPNLVKSLLKVSYDAHNAISDVEALGKLVKFTKLAPQQLLLDSFSPSAVHNSFQFNQELSRNISSLQPLVETGICERMIVKKIAGSGLNLDHLKTIHEHSGVGGLRSTFKAKNRDGVARVTNYENVLDKILPTIDEYFNQ